MKLLKTITTLALCFLAYSPLNAQQPDYKLVWKENFRGRSINEKYWSKIPRGGSDWNRHMSAHPSLYEVKQGTARLYGRVNEGIAPEDTARYITGGIFTKGKKTLTYGKVEIKARLQGARGAWPAIWMLPTDWEYGDWPKSGEIDIMENVGYDPDTIVGSSHTEKYNHAIGTQKNAKIACPDCYKAFHVYALEWEEDEYRLYVDDQLYFTFKNEGIGYEVWPYDKRFHILLNLAIGGNWGGQKGIDDSLFPHVFEIDYVRVYKK